MCCNNAEHGDMKSDAKEGNNSRSNGTNGHNDWSFGNKHKEADKHERNRGSHKWLSERRRHLAFRALLALQLGSYIDQQPMTPAQTVRTYGYTPDQGLLLRVDDVRVEPAVIEPGKPSKLVLTYSILDPNSARTLDVSEVRQIFSGDELLKDIGTRTIERKPGTFETQQEVTFPADLPDGLYALKGKVGVGEVSSSGESVFRVTKIASRKGDLYALNKMFFVRW